MKLKDLREEVRERADDTAGAFVRDSVLNRWLNLAVRRLWREHAWTWTKKRADIVLTKGDPLVKLPADCRSVTKVVNKTTDEVLTPKSDRWLQNHYTGADDSEPQYYTDGGLVQTDTSAAPLRRLRLYPTPDAADTLTVSYFATPASMDTEEDFSPLPEDFDEAVMLWALVRYHRKLDDAQAAADTKVEFDGEVQRLVDNYGPWQQERYATIDIDS